MEQLGGRSDVLGTTIEISSRPTEIVGVAPPGFDFPGNARLWLPVQNDDQACGRDCVYLDGIARLEDGVSEQQAREELARIASGLETAFPNANTNVTTGLALLQDDTVRNVRLALLLLLGSVGMVLLIACANVANLVLVRGTSRRDEIAVRAALGGSRNRLLSYLCTENLVLAFLGAAFGLLLASWGIAALKRLAPPDIPRLAEVAFDGTTFLFALSLAMMTTILFGLWPALQLSRSPLAAMLNSRGEAGRRHMQRSRSALVAAEVGLSLMLLIGAGLLLRSLIALQSVDPGFQAENVSVFTLALPSLRYPASSDVVRTFEELDDRFSAIPGIGSVGYINGLPLGPGENVQSFTRPDQPPPAAGQGPVALYRVVDSDYFRTLGIPLVAGRYFERSDRAGSQRVVIISHFFAEQFFPQEEPLGKVIQMGNAQLMIVGIAANVQSQSLERPAAPEMYVPHAQNPGRATTFVVRSELPPGQVLSAVRRIVQENDANMPLIRPGTLEQTLDQHVARPRFYMVLLTLFGVLAVSLAGIGTYGVVAYAVAQRTREIGLRIALGAQPSRLLLVMLWHGLKPAAIGIALGILGSLAASRLVSGLLFMVPATDPVTFTAVTALLAALVIVASLVPARRAMQVPPATALRGE
jgi:predicted permease